MWIFSDGVFILLDVLRCLSISITKKVLFGESKRDVIKFATNSTAAKLSIKVTGSDEVTTSRNVLTSPNAPERNINATAGIHFH